MRISFQIFFTSEEKAIFEGAAKEMALAYDHTKVLDNEMPRYIKKQFVLQMDGATLKSVCDLIRSTPLRTSCTEA